jgi:DNA replication and repair protein RecF
VILTRLDIADFRNLHRVSLEPAAGFNLIVGPNAAGKTNLIEALYFLGRARSFRTRQVRELIRTDADAFRLVAGLSERPDGRRVPVGIERSRRELTIRIDGAPVHSLASLARQTPVLLLNPNSHRLLEDGPPLRRRFLDWGLFYAEPAFQPAWKRYAAALRHRNAALRAGAPDRVVAAWDQELAADAATLDRLRKAFCNALRATLGPLAEQTLGVAAVQVDYRRGWPLEASDDLIAVLRTQREQDRRHGHTRLGPHRADFHLKLDGGPPVEHLSRGQQKLLVIALVLAQARLYRAHCDSPCILLIDDLPAELDAHYRERVLSALAGMETQLFITAIEAGALDAAVRPGARVYAVDHGDLREMV